MEMTLKVLLFGGGGFVGSNFNELYSQRLDITNVDSGRLVTGAFEYHRLDLTEVSVNLLCDLMINYDVVINLAAITRVVESLEQPHSVYLINTKIQANILEAQRILKAARNKNLVSIFASTGGAIAGETQEVITETIKADPISIYGASKLASEALTRSYCSSFGIDARIVRFTNIYGKFCDHKESVVAAFCKKILKNEPVTLRGNGLMRRDYIYADDACDAIFRVITKGKAGEIYLIGSGQTINLHELIRTFQSFAPQLSQMIIPDKIGEVSSVTCDVSKARRVLGWSARTALEDGLFATYEYLKAE